MIRITMTKNARYILEIINNSQSHLTAEQVYLLLKEKNKTVVQASVYNNLSFLYRQGLIRKISVEGQPDRYDNIIRHDHLICRNCGKISDITLADLTDSLQCQIGFPILSYDLKINYICDACLKQKQENERPDNHENEKKSI